MIKNQSRAKVCKLKEWPNAESHVAMEKYNGQLIKTGEYTTSDSQRTRSSQITKSGSPEWSFAMQIMCNPPYVHSLVRMICHFSVL